MSISLYYNAVRKRRLSRKERAAIAILEKYSIEAERKKRKRTRRSELAVTPDSRKTYDRGDKLIQQFARE